MQSSVDHEVPTVVHECAAAATAGANLLALLGCLALLLQELHKAGVQMPKFGKIGGILAKELGEDDAASALLQIP